MKQRIMAIFLSLCMMIGLLPATAFAADGGELVIGDSPVIITDGGNSQGNLVYDEETASITASAGDGVETPVAIGEGEVVIVPECICATEPGSLTMITESQSLTTIDGEATLELEATYSPEECVLSDGSHGEYENISYEITKVMKNEQSMITEQYADIAGNTLTVYGDDNEDSYTVYVRAKCGDAEKEVYSDEIAITVNTFTSAFVSAFVSNAPEVELKNADGELDISKGSIIITESGYAQGVLHYENDSGYSVQNSEGEPITETTWSGFHELTITGESNNATILIMSGSPEITLKDLKIIQSNIRIPGLVLVSSSEAESPNTATLILEGDNTFSSKDQVPGVQINKNATLTIQGSGTLNASTTNQTAGIGAARVVSYAINPDTKLQDGSFRSGGNLVIEGGIIHAAGQTNSGSIGTSYNQSFGTIEIKGGIISTAGSNSSLKAKTVEISGGTLTGLHKSILATNLNITGGNIGDSYNGEISGRKLTKLLFFDEYGKRQRNTEVEISEGENTWTALTDGEGMIITYLDENTTSIAASVAGGDKTSVTIEDGQGFIGPDCTCNDKHGTLTMITKPQSLTTIDGEATLDLEAAYSPEGCVLPDGFHGEYENIDFEVTKVVKNGQYQQISGYTSITANTLTVYGETNKDPYTVYIRAVSGPNAEVQSSEIAINVNTFVSEVPEGELDIEEGPIVITETGYTQGDKIQTWGSEPHAITITQTDGTTPLDSYIEVQSGNVEITLKGVNLTNSTRSPFKVSGSRTEVTVILEGENTLTSTHTNSAALAIGSESTVNIKVPDGQSDAYGILTATGTVQAAGIGGGRAIESGTVNIQSGTIVASAGAYVSGIGPGRKHDMKAINISGGHVTVSGGRLLGQYNDNSSESCADTITISGGYINANGIKGDSLKILGGNICGSYSDTISGRVLTKLYFVADKYGTPLTDTKVTVTENSDTWTAYTDENGIITTYLANTTTEISATIGEQKYDKISVSNHQALIGGDCSCSSFTGITWETGLPESITLHNLTVGGDSTEPVKMNYDVPAAQLVTDQPCNMPIHPSLPKITYELSVTKNEAPVAEENLAEYASFINNHLTLLPGNAPYAVTLTAKAGEKQISHRITVNKGETSGGETGGISTINLALGDAVINYTAEAGYTYTQGETGTSSPASEKILIIGDAPNGSVTVNGGSPTLIITQNNPNDVWTICETDATRINLQFSSFNGKLYFGEMEGVQSTLTQDRLTLNPENAQNITFGDDNIVCGVYTINGVGNRTYAVYGANLSGETVIQNNSSNQIDVDVNDNMVHLSSGQSTTIPEADYIFSGNGKENNVCGYIYENGTKLVYAGEGKASGPERSMWNEEPLLAYRGTITQVVFAPDIDEIAGSVIYLLSGIDTLAIKYATTVNGLYNARMKTLLLGSQVTTYTPGNYLLNLKDIVVEEGNTAFSSDEGVLYTADHTTLLVCPTKKTGDYALLDDCEIISNTAFSGSNLTTLTLNASLKEIGNRAFESAAFQEIRVAAGNTAFKSVDGALYSGDGDRLILCPLGRTAPLIIPEGVTALEPMAVYTNSKLTSITLPSSLESVDGYFLAGVPIKEMTINSKLNQANVNYDNGYCKFFDSQVLRSLTVPDGYDFANSNLFTNTSMNWVTGINVIGGQDTPYDGAEHGVTVTVPDGATVQYSIDGENWQSDSFEWKDYGNYTVYWQVTYNGGTVYSQTDFTIGGLEASEDWFTLSDPVTADEAAETTPVTLNQPAAAPPLEGGYTVKYNGITDVPTTAGSYLVTVDITAEGYVQETLTLGNYVILSEAQKDSKVISFVTNGGKPIDPIIAASNDNITEKVKAINPTRAGYIFADWYSDSALRNRVESLPTTMPGEHTTYYAKWTRDAYTITYVLNGGTVSGNPEGYTAETPTFTLKNPTKAGYEFTGWTWDGQDTPVETVTIEKGSSGNRVYTAKWEKITYTIDYPKDYDKVDGNLTEYTLDESTDITLNQPADRQGYTFIGWSMVIDNNSSYILPKDKPVIPAGTYGNLTLTGIWLADNQTLTFHANGGKFADGTETYVISGAYDSPLSVDVTNPTRSGYNFRGWFTDKECTQLFDTGSIETMPLSMDIYAGWKKKSSSSSESTEGSGTSSVSDHVVITTNSGKLTDSQIEEAVKKAEKDSVITIQAVKSDEVVLRAGAMETLVENENDLLIQLRDGEVTLPVKAMKGLIEGAKSSYEIGVSLEEQTSSDDATVSELLEKGAVIFDVVITVNGKEIHSFDKGLTLAFKVPGLKDMEEPVVLHLLQDGEQESYKPDEISGDTLTIKGIKNLSVFAVLSGNEEKAETENPFADVFENDYYFNSVLWAVTNGVTAGTSDITFSPDVTVSRAQMVTFLWRAAGSPAAEGSNPFTDVSVSDYYYNAVLWAVANGVTAGTSDTTFSPDAPVSRAQAVTFQWRAAGGPAVSGESFTDIPEGAYYGPAVTWAVANGITSGTGDHQFSPDAPVSRAQAVTFLYRQYK